MMKHCSPLSDDFGDLINLTPLLDVLFVVLILFILGQSPLLKVDSVDLAIGGNQPPFLEKPMAYHLEIRQNGDIYLDNVSLPNQHLLKTLKQLKINNPQSSPTVYCDLKAQFGHYQRLKNALETAGFTEMDLVLKSE